MDAFLLCHSILKTQYVPGSLASVKPWTFISPSFYTHNSHYVDLIEKKLVFSNKFKYENKTDVVCNSSSVNF